MERKLAWKVRGLRLVRYAQWGERWKNIFSNIHVKEHEYPSEHLTAVYAINITCASTCTCRCEGPALLMKHISINRLAAYVHVDWWFGYETWFYMTDPPILSLQCVRSTVVFSGVLGRQHRSGGGRQDKQTDVKKLWTAWRQQQRGGWGLNWTPS